MPEQIEPAQIFGRYAKLISAAVGTVLVYVITQDALATGLSAASTFGVYALPKVPSVEEARKVLRGDK